MRKSIVRFIVAALLVGSVASASVAPTFAGSHGHGNPHCNAC
jgi:hypothetical protein